MKRKIYALISIKKNVENILIPSEERHLNMYPMDFEEFLWANGNNNLMDLIRKCFEDKKPLGQLMHREAMDYFKQYLIVGGMTQESMIVNIAYNTTEPNIGLRLNRKSSALKCYMGDTGLLISLAFDEGMIMENIVAQMLTATGKKLYFFFFKQV